MGLPEVAARYVGVPFGDRGRDRAAVDCWGLVVLFYREQFEIALPAYDEDYATATDRREIAALMAAEVPREWEKTEAPQVGDAVLFRIGGHPLHCGIWMTPEHFLHCERGTATCIGRFQHPKWQGRLIGAFRYRGRP